MTISLLFIDIFQQNSPTNFVRTNFAQFPISRYYGVELMDFKKGTTMEKKLAC